MKCLGIALQLCCMTGHALAADVKARPANLPENYVALTGEELELATGPIAARLRKQYGSGLAGLFIEREQRRIVVRLTGDEPVAPETHLVSGGDPMKQQRQSAARKEAQLLVASKTLGSGRAVGIGKGDGLIKELSSPSRFASAMIEPGEGHDCADAATPIYTVIDKSVAAFALDERLFHVAQLLLAGGHKAKEAAQVLAVGAVVALSIGQ